jgi:predicted esterase
MSDARPDEHRLIVPRTARYCTVGGVDANGAVSELWIALHGYGQLARDVLEGIRPLAMPGRLLAAPEALSRFYVEAPGRGGHGEALVGGSWMTREDRDSEIADQIRYLDLVLDELRHRAPSAAVTLLGFSQGVATAWRWAALGQATLARIVLWGTVPPEEVDPARIRGRHPEARIHLVGGARDTYAPPAAMARAAERLRAAGLAVEEHRFDGGHRFDDATLAVIAG